MPWIPNTVISSAASRSADIGSDTTTLSSGSSVGALTITVNNLPAWVGPDSCFVVIDTNTTEAELRRVASVNRPAKTITFPTGKTLAYAHASDDTVRFITGGLIPWDWWGALPTNDATRAANNVLGFNRLTVEIYNLGSGYASGVWKPPGVHYIDSPLKLERDQSFESAHLMNGKVVAYSTFSFPDDSTAMFTPQRDGSLLTLSNPVSSRWGLRNIFFDGNNITGSRGVLSSPQQPDRWENLRIDNCATYGMYLLDVQQHVIDNFESIGCGTAIHLSGVRFLYMSGWNVEQHDTHAIWAQSHGTGSRSYMNSFRDGHIETSSGSSTEHIKIDSADGAGGSTGDTRGWLFDHLHLSNVGTETLFSFPAASIQTGYELRSIKMYGSPTSVTAIDDVYSGKTYNARDHFNDYIGYYTAPLESYAGASFPVGRHSMEVNGAGARSVRLGTPLGTGGYIPPNIYSQIGGGNEKHILCHDSSSALQFEVGADGTDAATGLKIATGTKITKHLSTSGLLNFGSISAGAAAELTMTLTGAVVGDSVVATPASSEAGLIWCAFVSASNTVKVRVMNATASPLDPANETWHIDVWGH